MLGVLLDPGFTLKLVSIHHWNSQRQTASQQNIWTIDAKNEKIETKNFGSDTRVSAPNEFFCSVPRLWMDCYNTMINRWQISLNHRH